MKKLKNLLLVLVAFLAFTNNEAKASHFAAADIYYEYLEPLTYRVHIVLYRDCKPGNAGFGGTVGYSVRSVSCNQNLNFIADTFQYGAVYNMNSLCPNVQSWCVNPSSIFPAYDKYHYCDTVVLPTACTDWTFSFNSCCRNAAIDNLTGPGGLSFYVQAELNNVLRPINSSAALTVDPIPYVCINQQTAFLNGPVDPDLDSIIFLPTPAWNGNATTPCGYVAPNTPTVPLPCAANSYIVDPISGTAVFTPTAIGQYVLAFTATEYDKPTGQKVGSVQRDVQINVLNCSAPPPSPSIVLNLIGGVSISTNPDVIGVCPGQTLIFDVTGTSGSGSNSLYSYANNAISCPGSTYVTNPPGGGVSPLTGTFTWAPTPADVGDHTLIITFMDSTCSIAQPIKLYGYKVITIKVLQGVDVGPDLAFCLRADSITIPALGPPTITQWIWTDANGNNPPHGMSQPTIQNPKVAPTQTTTYYLWTDANTACKNTDTITVYIDTSVSVNATANDLVLCEPGYVTLDATPTGQPPKYFCGQENLTCGTSPVQYGYGVNPTSANNVTPFLGTAAGGRIQMVFTAAELNAGGMTSAQRIQSLAWEVINKTSSVPFNITVRMGCTFVPDLAGGYIPQNLLKVVYENGVYSTVLGQNVMNFQTPFVWDGTSNLVVDVCFFNVAANGIDEVASSFSANNRYLARTSPFAGCQIPNVSSVSAPTYSGNRPNTIFTSCDLPVSSWQWAWEGPFLFDSTQKSTQAYVNSNPSVYTVYTKGGNGCVVWDSVIINLSNHGLLATPLDTAICLGDRVLAKAYGIGNAAGESYLWTAGPGASASDIDCANCISTTIKPKVTGNNLYFVERTDAFGCKDTVAINIYVRPKPNVTITNGDTITIKYGQQIQLFATGALRYSWTPVWNLNNPDISSPFINPNENTLYFVNGLDEFGCGNYDSIYVIVDYSNNLFVPNAFSPNGDGRNDVFRIANFGNQAIQEFRVYNRWGQEVFSANDNSGWDGTFKGVPQDNNTYMYLIRVAYANGRVETLKGDVILMR